MVWELGLYMKGTIPARHPRAAAVRPVPLLLPPQRCCGIRPPRRDRVEVMWKFFGENLPRMQGGPAVGQGRSLGCLGRACLHMRTAGARSATAHHRLRLPADLRL